MLENDGISHGIRRRSDMLASDDSNGRGSFDVKAGKRLILGDLGDFELQRALPIDDRAAMPR